MQLKQDNAVCSGQNKAIKVRAGEFLFVPVLIILLASCQREQDWDGAPEIRAKVESEQKTRTSLSVDESGAGTIYWNPSDQIDVFFGTKKAQYTSQNASDAIAATFKTSDSVSGSDVSSTNIWGLYPSNSSSSCNGSSITTTLPSTQYGVPDTFDKDIFPAVAHSSSTNLQFYNVCGGIKFNLAYDDIKKITFRGNNNENLAGTVSISFVDNLPKATVVNGVKEITLTPKTETTFTKGADYYFILLPGTLSAGFTMTFTATDGTTGTLNYTDKSVTITRSIFGRKGNVDAYASFIDYRQANSVIYYTSSNGQVVTPYRTGVFGANIISNEYVGNRGVITFDGEVTSIGRYAFYNRSGLTSIELPTSVSAIDQYAFANCTGLKSITVNSTSIPSVADNSFQNTNNCVIYVPWRGFDFFYTYKESWSSYAARIQIFCPKNMIYFSCSSYPLKLSHTDGFGANIISIEDGRIVFDGEVTSIGEWAFDGCDNLTSIIIPNSVTSIGDGAFNNCSYLKSVVIPESVTSIGSYVFGGCYWMKTITILNPEPPAIMDDTFYFRAESEAPYGFFYYHIFVPEDSVSAYKNAQYWDRYPYYSGYGWRNSDQIYPIMPFIASDFYVPTYGQTCYIDLDNREIYTINPFEYITIYHDDSDGFFWDRRGGPIISNGVWLEGNGVNGIPSGMTAWEFYHFWVKTFSVYISSLPEEIRSRVSYNTETYLFSFDNSSGEKVTGLYEIPITIVFNSMFWFAQPFTVIVVIRGKDVAEPHEAVDLGLSVKWATCNVGADNPEEYGDYFAWGETEPKSNYDWSTYKWCNGSNTTLTKYCGSSSYGYNGFTDNKTVLDLEDDAAHVNWGGNWRMPTGKEFTELRNNCTWTWTARNGVNGYLVTSKKTGYTDKSIFLPAAGGRYGTGLSYVGQYGDYWAATPGQGIDFSPDWIDVGFASRCNGFSVRPVSE